MKRIWDQSAKPDPYWLAKRRRRPLTIAQKASNHALKRMHEGKPIDTEAYLKSLKARVAKKRTDRDAFNHLRSLGLV